MQHIRVWGAVILAGVFVVLVAAAPRVPSRATEVAPASPAEESARAIPGNAFAGGSHGRLAPNQSGAGLAPEPSRGESARPIAQVPLPSPSSYAVPTLEAIKEKAAVMLPPAPSEEEMLPLPPISNTELVISPSGVRTPEEYVQYFIAHSREVRFDAKRFGAVLRGADGVDILPIDLVAQALQGNSFAAARDSFLVWKDFISAKLAFVRGIKVYGEAVATQKKMLGFDRLTLALIENALAVERGEMEQTALKSFFIKFQAMARHENEELAKQFQLAALQQHGGFFERIFGLFGVLPASAASPPFGATLGQPLPCECENAYWIPVKGPVVPPNGALFVPKAFLSSPLFFAFKTMRAGVWWLGLYTSAVVPCLDVTDECEGVWKEGAPIFMTGASN